MLHVAALVLLLCTIVAAAIAVGVSSTRRERILTPLILFCAIEVVAVWPALLPELSVGGVIRDYYPLILAATGLLVFVIAYVLAGGARVSLAAARTSLSVPSVDQVQLIRRGLIIWTTFLVALELYRFGGAPPFLSGGIQALIDPVGNLDKVAAIRETRRELTKGHTVMGAEYAGQGVINTITATGWQSSVIVASLIASWSRRRLDAVFAIAMFALAFIFLGSAGSRLPVLLMALAVVVLLSVRHRANMRHIALLGVLFMGIIIFVIPLSKGVGANSGLLGRLEAAIQRASQGNGQNNAMIIYLVDQGSLSLAWGGLFLERTLAAFPGVTAGDPFALRLTRLAYGASERTTGYSTPTQFGLMYADGGPVLVILGYAFVGVVLAFTWRWLATSRAWYRPALLAQGSLMLGYVSVTGIHGIPPTLIVVLTAILVIGSPLRYRRLVDRKQSPRQANLHASSRLHEIGK